ncbi:hypothetical protein G4X40_11810 [Rhodococcus sp. D2-41]|uniref:DUF4267 domain-containing protein n=1 Tax=Speluncibacter jeojiensis TaxID=2710754 RepID=A0A9X4RGA5_9ACTN|nr:hypothetical protein [Rhodococcus sp. D2-41]MDG3010834.1 hypothetical protein [Rhodococcus sp. D2-41]MDG3013806.1 hypothetical protein [Corynebacteriales bacterium D3-21]
MRTTSLPARILGALTATYGVAVAAEPALLLRPTRLGEDRAHLILARLVGLRDTVSGLTMVVAPSPSALRVAVAVRVTSDLCDTVVLGVALRGRPQRSKTVAVTAGWALLCAASAWPLRSSTARGDRR